MRRKRLVKRFLSGFDSRPLQNGKTGNASLQPEERSLRDGLDRERPGSDLVGPLSARPKTLDIATGGKAKRSESLKSALKREVREETGLAVTVLRCQKKSTIARSGARLQFFSGSRFKRDSPSPALKDRLQKLEAHIVLSQLART